MSLLQALSPFELFCVWLSSVALNSCSCGSSSSCLLSESRGCSHSHVPAGDSQHRHCLPSRGLCMQQFTLGTSELFNQKFGLRGGFFLGFFALVFLVLAVSSWELSADSCTDSSGLWCGAGAHRGSLHALPLIEGWGEDEAWLAPLVRPRAESCAC